MIKTDIIVTSRDCCLWDMFKNFLCKWIIMSKEHILVIFVGQRVLVCVDILCNII